LPTTAWPHNPIALKVLTGETDSDGNELFEFHANQPWDSAGQAFNYVEKELGLS